MKDHLLAQLGRSHPRTFCSDLHDHIKGLGRAVSDVETFIDAFNEKACEIIRLVATGDRYRDNKINQKFDESGNPRKKPKPTGEFQHKDNIRVHCNGCGKNHKGVCKFAYKAEFNTDSNTPYPKSRAGRDATARRLLAGQEPLNVLDLSYSGPNEVIPPNTTFNRTTTPSQGDGGRGRGGRHTGELCNTCDTLDTYLTSIVNNEDDSHLIPLLIKVAETEEDVDVDVEEGRSSPTPQSAANDQGSTTITQTSSQGLHKPFPVNILLDTGSLGPDGNYIHKDLVSSIDPLNIYTKRSTNLVCSGMDSSCVANNSFLYITVMLTKLICITIKCYILNSTPFDLIIGRKTIKKHHLVNRFPTYFGYIPDMTNDITQETENVHSDLPPLRKIKVKAKINKTSTSCSCVSHSTPTNGNNFIATGSIQPERPTISIKSLSGSPKPLQAIQPKRRRTPVQNLPHTMTAVQLFLEGHDGVPVDRNPNMGGRPCAVQERTYLCAGLIKTKEELLGPATTDDEEDDEISDLIDTFRYFTEKPSDENLLDVITYGLDLELNREIKLMITEFSDIFNSTLPKEPALLSPFRIEIDRSQWEVNATQLPPRTQTPVKNAEILKQTTELLKLGIIEHSNAAHYSQCLLAPKPHTDKKEWRFCIDYRFLNGLTSSLSWPLPNIKHMFERLGAQKAKYFAVMDFMQGFHQIAMDKASDAFIKGVVRFLG